MKKNFQIFLVGMLLISLVVPIGILASDKSSQSTSIKIWSHWANEWTKRNFVEKVAREFEAANLKYKVEITWYEKTALNQALTAALAAKTGPDIFYNDGWKNNAFILNGAAYNLKGKFDLNKISPNLRNWWGKNFWGLPLETNSAYMYYNKDIFKELGFSTEQAYFTFEQFKSLIKKSREKGYTPMGVALGDRPLWTTYLYYIAAQTMGEKKWNEFISGKRDWDDPSLLKGLRLMRELADLGVYPDNAMSLKKLESYGLFFNGKIATYTLGMWFNGDLGNSPEKGGPPQDFNVGVMLPPVIAENTKPYTGVSVSGAYSVSIQSKNKKNAIKFLEFMAQPKYGQIWVESTGVSTGIAEAVDAKTTLLPYVKKQFELEKQAVLVGAVESMMSGVETEAWQNASAKLLVTRQITVDEFVKIMKNARSKAKGE